MCTLRDGLLREIDAFLADTGMAPSRLGRLAKDNGKLVARLRAGHDVTLATADRLREVMAEERARRAPPEEAA